MAPNLFEVMGVAHSLKERRADILALLVAAALHTWGGASAATSLHDVGFFAKAVRSETAARLETSIDIETVEKEPEPVQPEPEPEPEPVEPEPQEAPLPLPTDAPVAPEAPAPAAAEAGEVLTSEPDPNEPLDLTNEGFISGTSTRFSGGVTTSDGTSKTAVRNQAARSGGVEGAKGKAEGTVAPPPVDKSRPAGILPISGSWQSCGFPAEAETEQINEARVRVMLVLGANGKPTSVQVLNDPGYGFGQHVRRCGMRFTFSPSLDKFGNPIAGSSPPFVVTFTR
jgi:periplasmic protein TonB